jgi:DNA-dependent RNA polymerase auxiliary subunit epsilon
MPENNIFFLKLVREKYNGLCNQLLSLVSAILFCIRTKKELLIVDKFLTEINTNSYCSIRQVLNLIEINKYLNKYNLKIVDGFYINSTAFRPISWNVIILAKKHNNKRLLAFVDQIYNNIYFSKNLTSYALNFISEKLNYNPIKFIQSDNSTIEDTNKKINVIHLRVENDGIKHWSKQNKMTQTVFKQLLREKYIDLIKNNIQKEDITLLLTGDTNNEVVQYMKENGYNIMFIDKKFNNKQTSRELNAVVDLIIGRYCNNVFIGCDGSSFSELLLKYIPNVSENGNVEKITLDLNNILTSRTKATNTPPTVYDTNDKDVICSM